MNRNMKEKKKGDIEMKTPKKINQEDSMQQRAKRRSKKENTEQGRRRFKPG